MKWPFTSRARFDDLQCRFLELETKHTQLEKENRRLVNEVFIRHGVRPLFLEADGARVAVVPAPEPEPIDPLTVKAQGPVTEAIRHTGSRQARLIVRQIETTLDKKHRIANGQQIERHAEPTIPAAQRAVAAELETLLSAKPTGNGAH